MQFHFSKLKQKINEKEGQGLQLQIYLCLLSILSVALDKDTGSKISCYFYYILFLLF